VVQHRRQRQRAVGSQDQAVTRIVDVRAQAYARGTARTVAAAGCVSLPGARSAIIVTSSLTVHFSEPCWQFLGEPERFSGPAALSLEIRRLLEQATPVDILRHAAPEKRYVVSLLTTQASNLVGWLAAIHDALPKDDPRRRLAEICIDHVEEAVRRPEGT
jgi:hypothetical protein